VVRQGFELDEQNSPAIMEIVRRLDGIPLALELAAARVRAMSVEQVAERLNDRFRLLTGGRRTALPRQQTLQALIEWSWNLLSANEQSLLRRLSVFSGGWELEAAEEVAGYDGLIVYDILDQLVSKSLVIAEEHAAGSLRYRMLESGQQFAQDKLLEGGEAEAIRNRHLACYQLLVRDLQEKMRGRDMLRWQAKMFDEVENLRAARDWSLDISPQKALELFGELGFTSRFWLRFSEARRWGRQVFEISEDYIKSTENQSDHAHYANLLIYLGTAEFVLGSSRRGIELLNQGITLSRQLGLQRKLVLGISMMIIGLIFSGNLQDVISLSEEAIEIARKENYEMELAMALGSMAPMVIFGGDRETAIQNAKDSTRFALASGNPWMLAMAEHQLARIAMALGQWEEAIDHFSISTEKFRAVHDRDFEMVTISDRAHIMRSLGDIDAAEAIYMETIDYFYQGRHMPGVAHQLESFGYIAVARQEFQRAATLFGAGANLRVEIGAPMKIPHEINEFESAIQTLKSVMDQKQLDQLMKQGAGVSIEAAIDYAKKSDR
jgi:tetratricopeptide (TPR) repeat protein